MLEIIKKNRTVRKFTQKQIPDQDFDNIIESVRFTASAANLQKLRYITVKDSGICEDIFKCLMWAGYLKAWDGPKVNERPTSYVIAVTEEISTPQTWFDIGIASEALLLNATSKGYGGCIFLSIDREQLKKCLQTDYEIVTVIALGEPAEKVVVDDVIDNNIKYYRDENGIHHVPKRRMEDLIVKEFRNR
ncbi:MAG: nitroreductase family protein [Candidatus Delongbacteria bacterium]|nr:nitroreductase family protein [Candidatus Delongbacteria bacterium]MBN2834708.1 nitroreductase family protein [Candidatus Delongbacteria bacterium]